MSVMCSRPSTPPRSMKAPKSVMFLTTPFRTWPTDSSFIRTSRLVLRSASSSTRHDDVAAPLVQLDDLELEALPEQLVDVRDAAQGDLTPRQERVHAHQVDDDAALDLLDERPADPFVLLVRFADLFPDPHEVG